MLRVHKQLWLVSPVEIYPHHKICDGTGHNKLMPRNNVHRWFCKSDARASRVTGGHRAASSLTTCVAGWTNLHTAARSAAAHTTCFKTVIGQSACGHKICSVAVYCTAACNQRFTQQNATENSSPLKERKFLFM